MQKINILKKSKLVAACAVGVLLAVSFFQFTQKDEDEITSLNSKYGLVAVESFGNTDENSSNLSYLFIPKTLMVNTLGAEVPETELVVKLNYHDDDSTFDGVFLLKLRTDANPIEIAKQYESIGVVSYAEPNYTVELSDTEEVNFLRPQRKILNSVEIESDIVVAVVDSGVDVSHKDLEKRVVKGRDFLAKSEKMSDSLGHGTHVAGIIAKNSSAKIMPLKFTDGKKGKISDLAKAIKYAVDNDADVINLSLGLQKNSSLLKNAVSYATKKDIPVVAAAGNYNSDVKYYPAAYDKAIAVAGLASDGSKLPQSNFGSWVDYSVVAQDIYSTLPGGKYGYATGTSEAAPQISAKIAEILKEHGDYDVEEILAELNEKSSTVTRFTADNLGIAL